ncbi:flagellar protein FlgN [Virgibacillus litoralis]|uniref:Flagellar biosynthesis/type III secretory pathway chaperone n=1 Tax=Virgibacillus litoralis TaxID=578221 RepID=A0ABS4HAQ5_9BACI|nr:flagellar protein FlgN [Virgibacillus litoralis]MBP1947982.1 flagellar biosynthesis/type III secretory pathway chaperone [Virgibacillus litoralis]
MSVQPIIQSLEKLIGLHESLLEISKQKTAVVKEGSVESLQPLLLKERKHVQALEQAEVKRQKEVEAWVAQHNANLENATITGILEIINDEQTKNELEEITITLTKTITELKQQEQLNQSLIQQSMQFVELSLNMMKPSIRNMNYGGNKSSDSAERSVFDSKA